MTGRFWRKSSSASMRRCLDSGENGEFDGSCRAEDTWYRQKPASESHNAMTRSLPPPPSPLAFPPESASRGQHGEQYAEQRHAHADHELSSREVPLAGGVDVRPDHDTPAALHCWLKLGRRRNPG